MQRRFAVLAAIILFASLPLSACARPEPSTVHSTDQSVPPSGSAVEDAVVPLPSPADSPTAFAFLADGHGWVATGRALLTTEDGGHTWTQVR